MRELDTCAHVQQTGVLRGVRGGEVEPEASCGAMEEGRAPERLRGGGEDEQLRLRWERLRPAAEAPAAILRCQR